MSEAQDFQSAESKETSDSEDSRPRSSVYEEKESPFEGYATPKSESTPTPKSDEPEKNVGSINSSAKPPTNSTSAIADQQPQHQQSRPGECNLLPVLVERLRSALELSCSSRSSEDQLPLEDSGVDSEEDLRNWASGLNTSIAETETVTRPKLDLKFLEELLLSDIQTALARLQDTLKRVDIGALTKYNSTLDPTNKLHLLRLISNLLAKLKIPEEAIKPSNPLEKPQVQRRNRSERHTIGVSTEELARARKWLEERNLSPPQAEFDFRSGLSEDTKRDPDNEKTEKLSERMEKFPGKAEKLVDMEDKKSLEKQFDQVHEKYMKDAINQQQSMQNRSREPKEDFDLDRILENAEDYRKRKPEDYEDNFSEQVPLPFYQQPSGPKYNKFLAKKSRLKRANTIDIPNYLKIQEGGYNGCISLRRPIDISDKVLSNGTSVIPSFQPKTENDRKFLALINKNNDTGPPVTSVPFKSFTYRQNSVADKNWNNRFSNIKTTFDKQDKNLDSEDIAEESSSRRGSKIDNRRKSMGNENEVVGSLRLSYGPSKKSNGFTHAPTSPFQKIEKLQKVEPPAFLKPGYIPKNESNLKAKVKMFDQEQNINPPPPPPARTKGKLAKTVENIFNINDEEGQGITENGHLNYHSFCKQFAPKGSNHLDLAKSKFMGDEVKSLTKDPIKKLPFVSHQNGPFQKSKQKLLKMQQEENFEPQKHYQKQYEVYPVNVNPTISNIGYRYDHRPDQKTKNHPRQRFENPTENRRRDFNKFFNELDRSSVGVQTGVDTYQDKNKFDNSEAKRKSSNASVQTSELYGNPKKDFHYPEDRNYPEKEFRSHMPGYQNLDHYYRDRVNSSEVPRSPLETRRSLDAKKVEATRMPLEPSRILMEASRAPMEHSRIPIEPSRMPGEYPRNPMESSRMPLEHPKVPLEPSKMSDHSRTVDPLRLPVDPSRKSTDPHKLPADLSKLPSESHRHLPDPSRLPPRSHDHLKVSPEHAGLPEPSRPLEPPRISLEQAGPPVPERSNYNNLLLRNYKSDQMPRSKSSYYDYEENPTYVPPVPIRRNSLDKIPRQHYENENKPPEDEFLPNLEHIQNQDISPDGVVTRYASAIATVASVPDSPEPFEEAPKPKIPPFPEKLDIPRIEQRKDSQTSFEEIQRHNLLQQNLSRRLQEQAKSPTRFPPENQGRHESPLLGDSKSPTSPSFLFGNKATLRHGSESGEGRRTQEKISMFEEINHPPVKRHFRPLNVPRADLNPPRINVVNPSKVVQPKFKTERHPILNNVSPVDSSDEYLMSCASKPSRNIVLTKSESWHQLAMSKNNLQVPPATSSSLLKPPKPKSPSSLKLSKQFEASSSSDNIKKMEERIQRYFQGPGGATEMKKEVKNKRTLAVKKNSNSLMRSHTMPHLYDEKIFDESTDVEKAFDSLFKETTRTDNRY